MSSPSKDLMAQVRYGGKMRDVAEVLTILNALPPEIPLTTTEAAIFLRSSVSTLERLRVTGDGPVYFQGGGKGAKGGNQSCLYFKPDLIAYWKANMVSSSMAAAVKKGQVFATLFDLAEREAFYIDERGNVESMVEENLLTTVADRIGKWDIEWLTPVEAASRRWSSLSAHKEFARAVRSVLADAMGAVEAGVEATDISESVRSDGLDSGARVGP